MTENLLEQYKGNKQMHLENQYLTIMLNGYFGVESITYCGDSELEAFRKFKELKGQPRKIIKADVNKIYILETYMIENYKVLSVIEDREN